uniref:Remorin C-terminal domain-containing protein n=1 Tax=Romanomermis culicivorax TaxID=13658 RepID=A0A915I8W9_ROMCU
MMKIIKEQETAGKRLSEEKKKMKRRVREKKETDGRTKPIQKLGDMLATARFQARIFKKGGNFPKFLRRH